MSTATTVYIRATDKYNHFAKEAISDRIDAVFDGELVKKLRITESNKTNTNPKDHFKHICFVLKDSLTRARIEPILTQDVPTTYSLWNGVNLPFIYDFPTEEFTEQEIDEAKREQYEVASKWILKKLMKDFNFIGYPSFPYYFLDLMQFKEYIRDMESKKTIMANAYTMYRNHPPISNPKNFSDFCDKIMALNSKRLAGNMEFGDWEKIIATFIENINDGGPSSNQRDQNAYRTAIALDFAKTVSKLYNDYIFVYNYSQIAECFNVLPRFPNAFKNKDEIMAKIVKDNKPINWSLGKKYIANS